VSVKRKNTEFSKVIAYDRHGNTYVYGGNWNPFNKAIGTDCSGCVVDILDAAINGTAMAWTRHSMSTESWRPPSMGGGANVNNGPFGTIMVNDPSQFPANAAVKVALHHGPGGGANSHMWCQIDNVKIETNGDNGTIINDGAAYRDNVLDVHTVDSGGTYGANNWWYLPGPIVEDGTKLVTGPSSGTAPSVLSAAPDTLFADVSEFQVPVTDAYTSQTYSDQGYNWPYQWISIRSNDGAHVDNNFSANYAWCVKAVNDGRLKGFIVYYYWRTGVVAVNNHMSLVKAAGGPHPKMVSMIDVESGGNPNFDVSSQLNSDYSSLGSWLGDQRRVIGYANTGDLNTLWPVRPIGLRIIAAGYGSNPNLPGQIAHQYTDGQGYGGGLPEGVAPFGNCDMNSADGLSPDQFAAALGLGSVQPVPTPTPPPVPAPLPTPTPPPVNPPATIKPSDTATQTSQVWDQLLLRWKFLNGNTIAEALGVIGAALKIPGYSDPTS
jgi:hypothetical protein